MARIVNTDNFGGDYPDESFVEILSNVPMPEHIAKRFADVLNDWMGGPNASRFYKVVKDDYRLQPGFEP